MRCEFGIGLQELGFAYRFELTFGLWDRSFEDFSLREIRFAVEVGSQVQTNINAQGNINQINMQIETHIPLELFPQE